MRCASLLLMIALTLAPSIAEACKCKAPPPPREAAAEADAVFTGEVLSVKKSGDFQLAVTIRVDRTWKGKGHKEVIVYTAADSAACGYGFTKGEKYLVYAYHPEEQDKPRLATNICTRTKPLADAKEDLDALGDPSKQE